MALAAARLSTTDYERAYGREPGWEYWFGDARRKPVPTHINGLLQLLLGELLRLAGHIASSEAELRNVSDWRPRPDVYGILTELVDPYATRPVDVVFEILSAQEDTALKCQYYSSHSQIPQIFVFDPEERTIASWDGLELRPVVDVKLANGVTITGATIWLKLSQRQQQQPPQSLTI